MPYASFDFETHLSKRAEYAPRIASGSWAEWSGLATDPPSPGAIGLRAESVAKFRELLSRDVTLVNQFFAFDIAVMLEDAYKTAPECRVGKYGPVPCLVVQIWDALRAGRFVGVDVCQQLIDVAHGRLDQREHHGYGLANIARWNGIECEDKEETWRLYYSQLAEISPEYWPEDARKYVLLDADLPLRILSKQLEENQRWIESYGHPVLHEAPAQTCAQTALYLVSAHGVRTNRARVEALRTKTTEHIASIQGRLQAAGLVRADGSKDTKAAKARVKAAFEAQGKDVPLTVAAKGRKAKKEFVPQISTEEDTMILSSDPLLVDYADYSSSNTLLTRVEDLADGYELPLNVEFTSIRATGRTSARKPRAPHKGVQSQNDGQGSGVRECREPREGCAFLWADFEAAEMHTLAQNCKDEVGYSRLGDLLLEGVDPHAYFSGVALLGLTGTPKEIADSEIGRDDSKTLRGWAKPFNFGKPGGMGNDKFRIFSRKQYGVTFSEAEAKHYGELWFRSFPEVKELHGIVKRLLGRKDTCTVRIKRGGFVAGGKNFPAACNFFFQAPAAAGVKAALCHVLYECYADPDSPLFGFRVWNLVHDELVLEGPIDRVHDAGERLRAIMEREFNFYTPSFPTPVEVISCNVWSKEAKPCFKDGKLALWIYEDYLGAKAQK